MDKKYQIFISSTYKDLEEERRAVLEGILELDHMPSGMELFPAANESQWEIIKQVISNCDYYIVIIGGRYGSIDTDGISYTEKEYNYALEQNIPTIGFIHKDPGKITYDKSETDEDKRKKLEDFKNLVQKKMVRYFTNRDNLKSEVIASLVNLIKNNPAIGWVRANNLPKQDTLSEIIKLKNENESLIMQLHKAKYEKPDGTENLLQSDDQFEINYSFTSITGSKKESWASSFRSTINEIFSFLSPSLSIECSEIEMINHLSEFIIEKRYEKHKGNNQFKDTEYFKDFTIKNDCFERIKIQFKALGLIIQSEKSHSVTDNNKYWSLTPYGDKIMTELVALKKPHIRFEKLGLKAKEIQKLLDLQNRFNKEFSIDHDIFYEDHDNYEVEIENEELIGLRLYNTFFSMDEIDFFPNLQYLSLSKCNIFIKDNPKYIEKLNYIKIDACIYDESKLSLFFNENLKNLSDVYLMNCKLKMIPQYFYKFVNLEVLDLSGNEIEIIDDEISNLKSLTDIDFTDNKITHISEKILDLSNLEYLGIKNNSKLDAKTISILKNLSDNVELDVSDEDAALIFEKDEENK